MICERAASEAAPASVRRSLVRSIAARTWDRDLLPTWRTEVTKTSVLATRGSRLLSRASAWMRSMMGWISSSAAFFLRSAAISRPSAAKGVSVGRISQQGIRGKVGGGNLPSLLNLNSGTSSSISASMRCL